MVLGITITNTHTPSHESKGILPSNEATTTPVADGKTTNDKGYPEEKSIQGGKSRKRSKKRRSKKKKTSKRRKSGKSRR